MKTKIVYLFWYFQFRKFVQAVLLSASLLFIVSFLIAEKLESKFHPLTFTNPALTVGINAQSPMVIAPTSNGENSVKAKNTRVASDPERLAKAICLIESNCNPSRIGDSGKSYGAFQIYLPAHPNVTKEQAMDFEWAKQWTLNHCKAYLDNPPMFAKCHNGIAKTTNDWYVERFMEVYNKLD